MNKIKKQMIGVAIVLSVVFTVLVNIVIHKGIESYSEYVSITDAYKKKCLEKFKTVDYEFVDGELYCKSSEGLVKFPQKQAQDEIQREIVGLIDTLIDGKFEKDLADPKLEWCGSSNQNVIQIASVT